MTISVEKKEARLQVSDDALKKAMMELRKRLQKSQTGFADLLGKSARTYQRYEAEDQLPHDAIVSLAHLGITTKNEDLTKVFTDGLLERLGTNATEVMRYHISSVGATEKTRRVADANLILALLKKIPENMCLSDEQRELMDLLLRVLDRGNTERISALREILKALLK